MDTGDDEVDDDDPPQVPGVGLSRVVDYPS